MSGVSLLTLLAALCGLLAAACWVQFALAIEGTEPTPPPAKLRALNNAAIATAGSLGLAAVAALSALYVRGVL